LLNWNIYWKHVVHVGHKNMNSQHVNEHKKFSVLVKDIFYNFHEKDLYLTRRFTLHSTG